MNKIMDIIINGDIAEVVFTLIAIAFVARTLIEILTGE